MSDSITSYRMAKYYDFDSDYLIKMEPRVRHYEMYSATSLDPSRSEC